MRTTTLPDGTQTQSLIADKASTVTTSADGTTTTSIQGPDPRFSMQAPRQTSALVKLPSGLTFSQSLARSVSLANTADPLTLQTQTGFGRSESYRTR